MKQTNQNIGSNYDKGFFEGKFSLLLTGLGAYFAVAITTASFFTLFILLVEEQSLALTETIYALIFALIYLAAYSILTTKKKHLTFSNKLRHIAKRIFDVIGSSLGMFFLLPLLLLIAIIIKFDSSGPMIIRLKRVGQFGKLIDVYKFRTTHHHSETLQTTRFGKYLRRFSIDELPQIYNVLEGDLSIVGTWPRIPENFEKKVERKDDLFSMKPGITGLWQVSLTDISNVEEYDLEYVINWSFWLDIKILIKTTIVVLKNDSLRLTPR